MTGITENLFQADLKLTATEYMLIVLGITMLGGLIGFAISRQPISAFIAGVLSFFVPGIFVSWRRSKRRREFADQLADALAQIAGSLRAGHGLAQSLDTVARQMPPPAGDEFLRVVREIQLGQPLTVALGHVVERIKNDDLIMVVASININRQIGGNLADILDTTAETIRERVRIKREIQVLEKLAEGLAVKEIAAALQISIGTAGFHLTNIYKKLQVQSQTGAVAKALRSGII